MFQYYFYFLWTAGALNHFIYVINQLVAITLPLRCRLCNYCRHFNVMLLKLWWTLSKRRREIELTRTGTSGSDWRSLTFSQHNYAFISLTHIALTTKYKLYFFSFLLKWRVHLYAWKILLSNYMIQAHRNIFTKVLNSVCYEVFGISTGVLIKITLILRPHYSIKFINRNH